MKIRSTVFVMLASAAIFGGCGGSGRPGSEVSTTADDAKAAAKTAPGEANSAPSPGTGVGRMARGRAIGKIRVVNAIAGTGATGPAIDVYDISRPDSGTKPLIRNLQYGQASDYVTPHGWTPGDTRSNLYVLPAGSIVPHAPLGGGNIDNGGFADDDQLTLTLFTTELGFGIIQIAEAGKRIRKDLDVQAPAGKGLLIVRAAVSRAPNIPEPELYLSIDGTCPTLNGLPAVYPIAPGDHALALITSPRGTGLTKCEGAAPVASLRAHVDAGQRIDVVAYGLPDALKLLAAPVPN